MGPLKNPAIRALAYIWAFPTTSVGVVAAVFTLASGGKTQVREGAVECYGGFATWFLSTDVVAASAMTLGHVILGRNERDLDRCRAHEQAHVRQVEIWGFLFLPAYVLASGIAWASGRHYYLDNWFEVDARNRSDDLF